MAEVPALLPEKQKNLAASLNTTVFSVIGNEALTGFERAFHTSNAIMQLKSMLTDEYMKPIMALQGNKLGFKTDKDDKGGYPIDVVKNCLIEAVLTGLQPYGNQFNIIAGNMYMTKEGAGHVLKHIKGLTYKIIPGLPRIKDDKTGAAVLVKIKWTLNGVSNEEDIDMPIKMNSFMGTDAVLGKLTRKARAWLFNTITGEEVADGDAFDVTSEVVSSKVEKQDNKASNVASGVKSLMGKSEPAVTLDQLNELMNRKIASIPAKKFEEAKIIISVQDQKSYGELHAYLSSLPDEEQN